MNFWDEPLPAGVAQGFRPLSFNPIAQDEWNNAQLSPPVIVENYLFADIALLIAAGGVGKTSVMLREAIHIALGLPLYGRKIVRPGATVILTAEDDRLLMIARLRETCRAMNLSHEQIGTVQQNVRIEYVGGEDFRLCAVRDDSVVLSPAVQLVVNAVKDINPVQFVIDPAVSFGVGEQRVNDSEQGLITACRRIRDELKCCAVRVIHHTGKANARDKTDDQYAGRGGSAMPDGARMVHIAQPMNAGEFRKATGVLLASDESGICLSLPKMSFCSPQPKIYLQRHRGFSYTEIEEGAMVDFYELGDNDYNALLLKLEERWISDFPARADVQSAEWVGYLLAEVLDVDAGQGIKPADLTDTQRNQRERCKKMVEKLQEEKKIVRELIRDKAKGRDIPYIRGRK